MPVGSELEPVAGLERASRDVIDALQAAVMAFDEQRAELAEAGDMEALAVGMVRLRELQKSFRILLDAVEQDVARLMPKQTVVIEGVTTLVRGRTATKVSWDHRALAKAVIAKAMEDGRVNHPLDVADALMAVAHFDYWRIGDAEKAGVDAKEFRSQEPGRLKVTTIGEGEDV